MTSEATRDSEIKVIYQGQHWRAVELPVGSFGWTESTTFAIQYLNHEGEWISAPGYPGHHRPTARQDAIDEAIRQEAKGPVKPPARMMSFKDVPVRWQFRDMIHAATRDHAAWVDDFGLQTGQLGPLDNLIRELEECVEVARRAKVANEEGDE